MSMRIYRGCEIAGHDVTTFLPVLMALRESFREVADREARAMVMRLAVSMHDDELLGLKEPGGSHFLVRAQGQLADRQIEIGRTQRRDPAVDFSTDVTIFPAGDKLLAIPFIEHPALRRLWESQPWHREYGFWSNTDAPEGVPETEWEQRGRVWTEILSGGEFIPSQCGYSFKLLPIEGGGVDILDAQAVGSMVRDSAPTKAERAKRLALTVHLKREGRSDVRPSEALELAQSPAVAAVRAELESTLPDITQQMVAGESHQRALARRPAA